MDIEKAREIRTRILTSPVTISIFVVIILLYAWLDVGQVAPTSSDAQRLVATLGGAVLYVLGLYFFLPPMLSSDLTARLPFFWKILLLVLSILVVETTMVFALTSSEIDPLAVANYYLTSVFTGALGILVFCAVYRSRLERLFGEDPITTIFGRKKIEILDPLQDALPEKVRGPVYQLEAQSPYVMVTTSNGSALIRMSMKTAVEQVDQSTGWQVHRSRWVHKSRVVGLQRRGRNRYFVDPDGQEFPISREMEQTLSAFLEFRD